MYMFVLKLDDSVENMDDSQLSVFALILLEHKIVRKLMLMSV